MTSDINPKFSSRELESCQNWLLPDVTSNKTLPSAEKEALDSQRTRKDGDNSKPQDNTKEIIDNVDDPVAPITADQLAAITEAAEKEGYEKGYQEGFEKGEAEGKEQGLKTGKEAGLVSGQQQVTEQCQQLQHVIDALMIPLENEQKQLEDVLLNMVTQLAEAVVLRELNNDSSHIVTLIDEAIKVLPIGTERFTLFLNPQDRQLIEAHLEQDPKSAEYSVIIHQDKTLLPGGCRLETKQTIVDFSVEQRLATVIEGFLHKRFVAHEEDVTVSSDKEKKEKQPASSASESTDNLEMVEDRENSESSQQDNSGEELEEKKT